METKEWRFMDKSSWPRGEWDNEPDKLQWPDAATGLPCLIVRGPVGALCGYVGVSEDHPLYKKDYRTADVYVHGGLTFSALCRPGENAEGTGICHTPGPGEPEHVWWLGFDCAHWDDRVPGYPDSLGAFNSDAAYKDIRYVQVECALLAMQLKEQEHA
jgi:hypothetical protein